MSALNPVLGLTLCSSRRSQRFSGVPGSFWPQPSGRFSWRHFKVWLCGKHPLAGRMRWSLQCCFCYYYFGLGVFLGTRNARRNHGQLASYSDNLHHPCDPRARLGSHGWPLRAALVGAWCDLRGRRICSFPIDVEMSLGLRSRRGCRCSRRRLSRCTCLVGVSTTPGRVLRFGHDWVSGDCLLSTAKLGCVNGRP